MEKFRSIKANPMLEGLASITNDIIYSRAGGVDLKMKVIEPWKCAENAHLRYPLILFIQGSGWTTPDFNYEIPQLAWYARQGYVVATVSHRDCRNGFPFPAFLQDVKCALRYLRAHAEEFKIDPERVTVFGTSSGGNTALLVGLTGDDERYKTDEYADQSDAVSAVVECFGPTDLFALYEFFTQAGVENDFVRSLFSGDADSDIACKKARDMSPLLIAEEGVNYPPTLILHGDSDNIVPYESQGVRMFEKLDELGQEVSMVRIEGADHEGAFWSRELHDIIIAFIDSHMKENNIRD